MGPLIAWGVANDAFINLSEAFQWSCLNGKDVLIEYFVNQSETKLGFDTTQFCTFRKTKDKRVKQVWYNCNTCNMIKDDVICNACVKICHSDHEVKYVSHNNSHFCACGANEDGSCFALNSPQTSKLCTKIATNRKFVIQHVYRCKTCEMKEVCSRCAKTCHESHELDYGEFTSTYCDCKCGINVEELISYFSKFKTEGPFISWALNRFSGPNEAFNWTCENGAENLKEYLISHITSKDVEFEAAVVVNNCLELIELL